MKKNSIILEQFKKYINEYIENEKFTFEVKEELKYVLLSNGKYIRPMLFFLLLEENHINSRDYFNIGLAVEMIHTYSLIHDDLPAMDNDDYRRGKLSAHKKFGEDQAILLGDLLLTHSFEVLINNDLLSSNIKVKMINILILASGAKEGMISGQIKDVENKQNLTLNELKKIHQQKTGAIISVIAELALQVIGNSNKKYNQIILQVFDEVGKLYQIQDDYFDKYSKKDILGKSLNKDEQMGKVTYTYFYNKDELEKILFQRKRKLKLNLEELKFEQLNEFISNILERKF